MTTNDDSNSWSFPVKNLKKIHLLFTDDYKVVFTSNF